MTFLYLIVSVYLVKLLQILINLFIIAFAIWLLIAIIKRIVLRLFYKKIKKVIIVRKKELTRRHDVPTGYIDGYFGGEIYSYEYEHTGVKYKTRVYFGEKFFLFYTFYGTDPAFIKILNDDRIIKNTLPV